MLLYKSIKAWFFSLTFLDEDFYGTLVENLYLEQETSILFCPTLD